MSGDSGMLVGTEVLETIPRPWFEWARFAPDSSGEDSWFCLKAHRAGFSVWCDLDAPIGHIMPDQHRAAIGLVPSDYTAVSFFVMAWRRTRYAENARAESAHQRAIIIRKTIRIPLQHGSVLATNRQPTKHYSAVLSSFRISISKPRMEWQMCCSARSVNGRATHESSANAVVSRQVRQPTFS
jgi:hypothetical protein